MLRAQDIDLEAIAWHLGAVVKYRHMDSADGTIIGSLTRAVIAINSSTIPTRQRFSLARELGHWHFHRGRVLFCGPGDIGNFAGGPLDPERQADAFASDLILPGYLVRPKISKFRKVSLDAARELADEFYGSRLPSRGATLYCKRYYVRRTFCRRYLGPRKLVSWEMSVRAHVGQRMVATLSRTAIPSRDPEGLQAVRIFEEAYNQVWKLDHDGARILNSRRDEVKVRLSER